MRTYHYIIAILCCCLVLPAFAVETPEATAKRVKDLEKANLVLKEDLAGAELELATLKDKLKAVTATNTEQTAALKTLVDELEKERAARKALEDKLTQMIANEAAARKTLAEQVTDSDTALAKRIADLDSSTKQAMAAQNDLFNKELLSLKDALDTERKERLAAENKANEMDLQLAKQDKKNRTITYILSGLLAGAIVAK